MAKVKPQTTTAEPAAPPAEYTVVARRYRPQQFAELIGQEHVAAALVNALQSGRVAHAYLFTGARGVGKTSAARILAKALNCVKGPTAVPMAVSMHDETSAALPLVAQPAMPVKSVHLATLSAALAWARAMRPSGSRVQSSGGTFSPRALSCSQRPTGVLLQPGFEHALLDDFRKLVCRRDRGAHEPRIA